MEFLIFRVNECDDFFYVNVINCVFWYYIFFLMNNKNYLNRVYINVKRDFFLRLCVDILDFKGYIYIYLCIWYLVKFVF